MKDKKTNINPTAGYVLLAPFAKEEKTASGIYLPDSADEKPQKATVLAVGAPEMTDNGKKESPVKKGDVVIYKKWGGSEVKLEGKDYIFAKFDDVLAVLG